MDICEYHILWALNAQLEVYVNLFSNHSKENKTEVKKQYFWGVLMALIMGEWGLRRIHTWFYDSSSNGQTESEIMVKI